MRISFIRSVCLTRQCYNMKVLVAFVILLHTVLVQCSRQKPPKCFENYMAYHDCDCFEIRPNFKQLTCKNMSCHKEFSFELKYVQGYNVRRLILENSELRFLPTVIFDGNFTWLEVSNSVLKERLFQDIPENNKIEHVMLNEVKIADGKWDWQSIAPFKRLVTLRMRKVPVGGLQNFNLFEKSLKHIVLHACDVRELKDDQFRKYKELEMIDIRHDRLKELKRSMFPTPSKIRIMIFRNNHLTSLPEDLFEGMRNLIVIDFQQNRLATISENIFKPVASPAVFLQVNPLECDCKMKWILEVKMVKGKCSAPDHLLGKELKNISEEDFSHC